MPSVQTRSSPPFDVLSAYRDELSRRPTHGPLTSADDAWLAVGVLLSHAGAGQGEHVAALLEHVRDTLRPLIGDERWARGAPTDPTAPESDRELAPRVRVLCEWIEDEDAAALADAIARAYLASGDQMSKLERGRIDALRARFAWKRGDHAGAEALYAAVARAATRIRSPELKVRALIGSAVLGRLRGNYPASQAASERAVSLAESHGFVRLGAIGHHVLMVAAATKGHLDTALHHAWRAYEGVRGDSVAEGVQLADLGRLFYAHGHNDLADAALAAALQRPLPRRSLLPALGAAALTAARRGDQARVASCAARIHGERSDLALPYATAASLLDVAEASGQIRDRKTADACRNDAMRLAKAHGYHELEFRADALVVEVQRAVVSPTTLSPESEEIGGAVRVLAGSSC